MGKNTGVVRRPIEYILIIVLVMLVVFGFWVYWYTDKQQADFVDPKTESSNYVGTLEEINQLTEDEILSEEQLYSEVDSLYETSADSSADNVAGAYDESEY